MSTTEAPAKTRPRRRKPNLGPELPMKPTKPAWTPKIFRRSDRSRRLYARVRNQAGKIVIRSTGQATDGAAREWVVRYQALLATAKDGETLSPDATAIQTTLPLEPKGEA